MYKVIECEIEGVKRILIPEHVDSRGTLNKIFSKSLFRNFAIDFEVEEWISITSMKGSLRCPKMQLRHPQKRLLFVERGEIFDVCIDLRAYSRSFKKWVAFRLKGNDATALYIPEGVANGFLTLTDCAHITYLSSTCFVEGDVCGIVWDDKSLNIEWPINKQEPLIVSDGDGKFLSLKETVRNGMYMKNE